MLFSFCRIFRYDELCSITPKHIEFHCDNIRIFVPRSKTDVYREGNYVFISASRSKPYCPVGVLQRHLDLSGVDLYSSLPLFRPPGGGVLPYMTLKGTCGPIGYGFQGVLS